MILFFLSWLVSLLLVLLAVAFFTLFERKLISLVHLRLGPNKPRFLGLVVPLLDAFKLLRKSYYFPYHSNFVPYFLRPFLSLSLSLILWYILPSIYFVTSVNHSFLIFLLVTSLIVYPLLISGWSSNSKYSLIGCLRSIAQSISYESVLSTLALILILISSSYQISSIAYYHYVGLILILPLWIFCVLAETHRAPFDFSESESELVSGFNTEYRGGLFAFIFLREYSSLMVSSYIIVFFFLGGSGSVYIFKPLFFIFKFMLVLIVFILIRVTYCRFRYDLLISSAWKNFLPISLYMLILSIFLI